MSQDSLFTDTKPTNAERLAALGYEPVTYWQDRATSSENLAFLRKQNTPAQRLSREVGKGKTATKEFQVWAKKKGGKKK